MLVLVRHCEKRSLKLPGVLRNAESGAMVIAKVIVETESERKGYLIGYQNGRSAKVFPYNELECN